MCKKDKNYTPNSRITFVLTEKDKIELKIMSILTKKSMSDFIRFSIQEKIKDLKEKNLINFLS
jgi:hypothetical protein